MCGGVGSRDYVRERDTHQLNKMLFHSYKLYDWKTHKHSKLPDTQSKKINAGTTLQC